MPCPGSCDGSAHVALHPEGVDRNYSKIAMWDSWYRVALHPEGVDRNIPAPAPRVVPTVALHPEGVDRNSVCEVLNFCLRRRPPPGGRG